MYFIKPITLVVVFLGCFSVFTTLIQASEKSDEDSMQPKKEDIASSTVNAEKTCGCDKLNRNHLEARAATDESDQASCLSSQDQCEKVQPPASKDTDDHNNKDDNTGSLSDADDEDVTVHVEEEIDSSSAKKYAKASNQNLNNYPNSYDKDTLKVLLSNPMVKIEGGNFFMGTEQVFIPQDGESPMRPVLVNQFYMDTKEVSNAEFSRFVAATNHKTEVN